MKNAILLHGTSSGPKSYWLPSLKKFLEEKGYSVWAPKLPGKYNPNLKEQLPFVLENGTFNNETIMIGHSAGCPLILSVLENVNVKIKKAILVAGWARPLTGTDTSLILQDKYDWEKIKSNVEEIIFINSDNDPWGCDDKEGKYMQEHLGGQLIVNHEGHMGSLRYLQPYKKFPLLEELVL